MFCVDIIAWRSTLSNVREPMCGVMMHVIDILKRMRRLDRLVLKHVPAIARKLAAAAGLGHVLFIHQRAAGAVDDDRSVAHLGDALLVDEVAILVRQVHVQAERHPRAWRRRRPIRSG